MKNDTKISVKGIICCIFSFVAFVNHGILIWMGKKSENKKIAMWGYTLLGITMGSILISVAFGEIQSNAINTCLIMLMMSGAYVPIIVIFCYRGEFVRRCTLLEIVRRQNIDIKMLTEEKLGEVQLPHQSSYEKSSQALFGDKGILLLKLLYKNEIDENKQRQYLIEQENLEKERKEKESREIERIRLQVEIEKAKAEAAKAEAEIAKAKVIERNNEKELEKKVRYDTSNKNERYDNLYYDGEEKTAESESKPAVLRHRTDAGTIIDIKLLEDPAIFDDLIDAGLLNLEGCLTVKEVLGAKLTKTCDSLTPLTYEVISR